MRLHRAGEKAPYTGPRPAGTDFGPAIPEGARDRDRRVTREGVGSDDVIGIASTLGASAAVYVGVVVLIRALLPA